MPLATTAHPSTVRLGWLDLLRGVAALVVAAHHGAAYLTPDAWRAVNQWVNPGKYGVLLFFLISGYIIPASLERHGKLRAFWIGRAARIYPLLLVCLVATVVPVGLGWWRLHPALTENGVFTAVAAHLTMLQDLLGVPSALNVLWTLSYELVFYLLVAALFVARLHRASAALTAGLATVALVLGGVLPMAGLSEVFGAGPVALAALVVLVGVVAAAVTGTLVRTAAVVGGCAGLALVLLNGRAGPWEGVSVLAVMFLGTALYRAEHGQSPRWTGYAATAAVGGGTVAAGLWHGYDALGAAQVRELVAIWALPLLLALLSFAAGWAVRGRRTPRPLMTLGAISYSVYLVHAILLLPLHDRLDIGPSRPLALAGFLAATVALSWATHRWVELPCQRWGRTLAAPRPAPERAAPEPVGAGR
ncbi:acyltransferase [Actinocorallia sp. API 0066]|uniref:acyltransferase family protein n=1 Tax=Actinocorallia sp. API 0066 TaxID=2896846 RepID=UPI001E64C827|nr:acyltransferase [Actinocorallia sp. API 0066]MCD0449518.1 acyltransferase [Actinocorallia sp. API 0066]